MTLELILSRLTCLPNLQLRDFSRMLFVKFIVQFVHHDSGLPAHRSNKACHRDLRVLHQSWLANIFVPGESFSFGCYIYLCLNV